MRNTTRFLLTVGFLLIASSPVFAQTCTQADNNHPDSVALTWADNSTDESGFVLERKQDAGAYAVLVSAIGANITAYTDGTVKRGAVPTTYSYRIKAVRSSDKTESAYSNESCITFAAILPPQPQPLKPPSGLTTAAVSTSTIRITWEDTPAYPGYVLDGKLSKGNDTFTQIATTAGGSTTYDWAGRKRYTSYCVRLRGDQADAEYSQMSCATTSK